MKATLAMAAMFAVMIFATTSSDAQDVRGGSFRVAEAGSCQSWFSICAARCGRSRDGHDKCVSDHCSPKLSSCRSSHCWQEGANNGGGLHCGLR